jgi:rhodanese-related sulfurtransferase
MSLTAADMVQAARARIREIAAAELPAWREQGSVLVDVREPAEFATGHIEGAINIPRGVLEFEIQASAELDNLTDPALAARDRPLVLYCRSGGRTALAAESLGRMGFTRVASLAGGIGAWRDGGGAVVMR